MTAAPDKPVTLRDLADECGVSSQSLTRRAQRMGIQIDRQPHRTSVGQIHVMLVVSSADADKLRALYNR